MLIKLSILGKITIGFRSNSVVNPEKFTIYFRSVNFEGYFYFRSVHFFDMCAPLVKAKILHKSHFLKDILNF